MGLEDLITPPEQEQSQVQEQQPQEEQTQTQSVDEQKQTQTQQTQEQPQDKDNNTIRQMRDQIKQNKAQEERYKALLQKIGNGKTLEELEAQYQAEEDKRNATSKGIPVEVEARIRQQEERIKQLEEQNIAYNFNVRANALMAKENLDQNKFLEFADSARKAGFDITRPDVDLNVVYRALNYDTLIKKVQEDTRQSVLQEIQTQKQNSTSPNNINNTAKTNQSGNDVDNASFMNSLFEKFNTNNK